MTRIDGRFIKPGSIPADRLDPAIPLGGSPDGSVAARKLAASLLAKFAAVTWGERQPVGQKAWMVPLQIKDFLSNPIPATFVLRVTCDERARLTLGDHGIGLSGTDSPDLIAQTDETGRLDLVVSCSASATITLAAGATQGSPMLDASALVHVQFT